MIFNLFNRKKVVPLNQYVELKTKYNKLSVNFKEYKDKMEIKLMKLNREIGFLERQNEINKQLILRILPFTTMSKEEREEIEGAANDKLNKNIFTL